MGARPGRRVRRPHSRSWTPSSWTPRTVGPTPTRPSGLEATVDGGRTWSPVGLLPQPAPNGQIFGVGHYRVTFHRQAGGALIGWYQGATTVSFTIDGGRSWRPVALSVPAAVAGAATNPM